MFESKNPKFKAKVSIRAGAWVIKYGKHKFDPKPLMNLITLEHTIRDYKQEEEKTEIELFELEKSNPTPKELLSDKQGYHESETTRTRRRLKDQLQTARKLRAIYEHELVMQERALPDRPLREMYEALRKDPGWYLREELIHDCAVGGGCCGRDCGCCEKRHFQKYQRGIGHCSIMCACCAKYRGMDTGCSRAGMSIERKLRSLLVQNGYSYLVKMLEAYFSKPTSKKTDYSLDTSSGTAAGTSTGSEKAENNLKSLDDCYY